MGASTAAYWMFIMVSIASATGKPVSTDRMRTQKRQSDQRVAELETLLALQKYGAHHYLHSQSLGDGEGSFFPAYGIIDFNKIGRKKKSSPASPLNEENVEVPNWVLSPSSSWGSASANRNPSSDTIRISNRSNTNIAWKAALDPMSTEVDSLDDDNSN